jgi:SAM-dependent methyltransferase
MTPPPDQPQPEWWEAFFASPDCLPLSYFPTVQETREEVAALERLLKLQPGAPILDICCGAGRHLLPLLRRGYDLTGLDWSPWLLGRAREAAGRLRLTPRLVRGDARRLPFADAAFDTALLLFNSFGYCETDAENEQMVREAARCLRPGGQFLLDTRNPQFQILFAPLRRTVSAAGGRRLTQSSTYDRERHRLEVFWHQEDGKLLHRAGFRLYQLEELQAILGRLGLEEVGVYGGYDGVPFGGYERVLLYHARKRV